MSAFPEDARIHAGTAVKISLKVVDMQGWSGIILPVAPLRDEVSSATGNPGSVGMIAFVEDAGVTKDAVDSIGFEVVHAEAVFAKLLPLLQESVPVWRYPSSV